MPKKLEAQVLGVRHNPDGSSRVDLLIEESGVESYGLPAALVDLAALAQASTRPQRIDIDDTGKVVKLVEA